MKSIISMLLASILILFSGCADKRIVLVPQAEYYPTFDTSDFNTSKKYKIDMWVSDDNESICTSQDNMIGFIKNTKELRSNYNILLNKLNKFNKKIIMMNEEQKKKKPTEVDSIPNSWYK